MILEYEIPNGTMTINADVFFEEADRATIRKLLKDYQRSGAGQGEYEELIRWLDEEVCRVQDYEAFLRNGYSQCLEKLQKLEQAYKAMKNLGSVTHTRDKEKLKEAREKISELKDELLGRSQVIRDYGRQEMKYQWCIELVKKMMEDEDG